MPLTLSLNTNPLVNRFADPDDLIDTVARDLKLRDLQLTHEFINPSWPAPVIRRLTRQMGAALRRTGVRVTSGMTGPYGRLNHFGHPGPRTCGATMSTGSRPSPTSPAISAARSVGTQFAIFTYRDYDDPARREELIQIAIDCWAEVAEHAKAAGLDYVFWEPMSVGREFGETIASCLALQDRLTAAGHGGADVDDGRHRPWRRDQRQPRRLRPLCLGAGGAEGLADHPHQAVLMDKGGHRPFTAAFNARGSIQPEPLLAAFAEGGAVDNEICLELSFKEREPNDREVIPQIAESVAFWAPLYRHRRRRPEV